MESSQTGFILDFWNLEKNDDFEYTKLIIYLIAFHYLIIMLIWSLLMVLFTNPGYLSDKYVEVFSAVNLINTIYEYLENYQKDLKDLENLFDLNSNDINNYNYDNNEKENFKENEGIKFYKKINNSQMSNMDNIVEKYSEMMEKFMVCFKCIRAEM